MDARDGQTWAHQRRLTAVQADTAGDSFGSCVALSPDSAVLAVGAAHEDGPASGLGGDPTEVEPIDAGAVYVFVRTADAWSQPIYVKSPDTRWGDLFGTDVALTANGDTLAVGARGRISKAKQALRAELDAMARTREHAPTTEAQLDDWAAEVRRQLK